MSSNNVQLQAADRIKAKADAPERAPLGDQEKVEILAHNYMPTIIAYQRAGVVSKDADPWLVAVDATTASFKRKFGREPKSLIPKINVQDAARAMGPAVHAVVIPSLTGELEKNVPTDTGKRAPARELAESVARVDVSKGVNKAIRGGAGALQSLVGTASSGIGLAMFTSGIISRDEYSKMVFKASGLTDGGPLAGTADKLEMLGSRTPAGSAIGNLIPGLVGRPPSKSTLARMDRRDRRRAGEEVPFEVDPHSGNVVESASAPMLPHLNTVPEIPDEPPTAGVPLPSVAPLPEPQAGGPPSQTQPPTEAPETGAVGRDPSHPNLVTLADYISKFAPPTENDTNNYISFVSKELDVPSDTPFFEIQDVDSIAKAQARLEGFYKDGTLAKKLNNPTNLRFAKQPGAKEHLPTRLADGTPGLAIFPTEKAGWLAAHRQIRLDQKRSKRNWQSTRRGS